MTRFRTLLALCLASLLFLSACSDATGSAAATVNGVEISDSDFRTMLHTLADHPEFTSGLIPVPARADGGSTQNRVDSDFAAAVLETEILLQLVDSEFNQRNLTITDEDLARTRESFGGPLSDFLAEMPDSYVQSFERWNTQLTLIRDALASDQEGAGEVTDEEVAEFYEQNRALFDEQVCAQHILVETEAEADAIVAQLNDGADFAALAAEHSTDPSAASNQGDLGCTSPDRYVPTFADAVRTGEIGEVLGPVESEFGFHVIVVTDRGVSLEDASADIRAQLEAERQSGPGAALGALLEKLLQDAEVTVSSRYGSWDQESGRVLPPAVPDGRSATVNIG